MTRSGRRHGAARPGTPIADFLDVAKYPVLVPDRAPARALADVESRGGQLAADPVLPELSSDQAVALLPDDPNELLTSDERRQLVSDLIKLATLRRDAEIASGSLRLA